MQNDEASVSPMSQSESEPSVSSALARAVKLRADLQAAGVVADGPDPDGLGGFTVSAYSLKGTVWFHLGGPKGDSVIAVGGKGASWDGVLNETSLAIALRYLQEGHADG